jgi:hypothetical protein
MYHQHPVYAAAAEQHTHLLQQAQQIRLLRQAYTQPQSGVAREWAWWRHPLTTIIHRWPAAEQPGAH